MSKVKHAPMPRPTLAHKKMVTAAIGEGVETLATQIADSASHIDVEIDSAALQRDLQAVVDQHMTGAAVARPPYNLAGDLLCLAHENARKGDMRSALRFFASMMETEDMDALVEGISQMNADTDLADTAAVAMAIENGDPNEEDFVDPEAEESDEVEDLGEEFASEEPIDSEDEDLGDDEDDEDEALADEDESVDSIIDSVLDEDDETGYGEDEPAESMSDDEEEDLGDEDEDTESYEELAEGEVYDDDDGDHEFRGTESDEGDDEELEGDTDQDEDDEDVPMGGASSVTASRVKAPTQPAALASVDARIRAVMNKATLSGTVQARRSARNLVKQK